MSRTAVNGVLVLATAYTLLPPGWLLTAAAKNTGDLLGGRTLSPATWHLGASLHALFTAGDGGYVRWYANSLPYAGIGALLCALVCVCVGYVPGEVLEAARMDGAGELRTFWSVGLPMVMPGFVTVFLFQFTAIWNNFFLPLVMLSDNRLFPLSLGLYSWNTQTHAFPEYYPLVVTGSLLGIVPLVVAFIALQRHWKAGLTAGSVK
ncbi:carbohydrate ABC transporter permease [Streptomyces sp. 16-176A]